MPNLIPSRKFLEDAEAFRRDPVLRKSWPKRSVFSKRTRCTPVSIPSVSSMIPQPGPYGSISDIGFLLTPAPTSLPEILIGQPHSPSCASLTTTISTAAPDEIAEK
jgi:hypothetical protein